MNSAENMRIIRKKFDKTRAFSSRLLFCSLFMGSFFTFFPLQAAELKARYAVSLGALSVGQASLTAKITPKHYQIQATMTFTGLAGLVANIKGTTMAAGTYTDGTLNPMRFVAKAKSGEQERVIQMNMARGAATSIDISPPLPLASIGTPLVGAHKRAILDPISALIMPVAQNRDMLDPKNCNRTLPILDGGARFTIDLSYNDNQTINKKAYKGPVLVCAARYTSIAGYQANADVMTYMQNNKNMEVWLAPLEGTRFLVPVRVTIQTTMGVVSFDVMRWDASTHVAKAG